jgi:hypothetical protein
MRASQAARLHAIADGRHVTRCRSGSCSPNAGSASGRLARDRSGVRWPRRSDRAVNHFQPRRRSSSGCHHRRHDRMGWHRMGAFSSLPPSTCDRSRSVPETICDRGRAIDRARSSSALVVNRTCQPVSGGLSPRA